MKDSPETAQDAIDVDPQLIPELDRLAQGVQDELKSRYQSQYVAQTVQLTLIKTLNRKSIILRQ